MKFFVTGAKGFIGSNLVKELKKNSRNKVVVYNKDLCQKIRTKNDFDVIFHLAAISDTRYSDDVEILRNNISSFINILEFALKGKSKLIYASSAAVYGEYKKTAYAVSKIVDDEIAQYFFNQMPIVGLRPFNVFGPNEIQKGYMASMITQWASQIKKGQRPKAFGDARNSCRDHIYVKDAVKAFITAIDKKSGIYDVGRGECVSYDNVLRFVQKALNTNLKPIYINNPYKKAYQRYTKADISWGFKPDWSLEKGIRDYLTKRFPR